MRTAVRTLANDSTVALLGVGVCVELGVTDPVPALNALSVLNKLQQSFGVVCKLARNRWGAWNGLPGRETRRSTPQASWCQSSHKVVLLFQISLGVQLQSLLRAVDSHSNGNAQRCPSHARLRVKELRVATKCQYLEAAHNLSSSIVIDNRVNY